MLGNSFLGTEAKGQEGSKVHRIPGLQGEFESFPRDPGPSYNIIQVEGGSYEDIEKSVKYSEPFAKTDRYINMREVSLRVSVPPGKYVIIASTFRRRDEGEFLLRLFLTRGWGSSDQSGRRTARSGLGYQ